MHRTTASKEIERLRRIAFLVPGFGVAWFLFCLRSPGGGCLWRSIWKGANQEDRGFSIYAFLNTPGGSAPPLHRWLYGARVGRYLGGGFYRKADDAAVS